MNTSILIDHIETCLEKTNKNESKLNKSILDLGKEDANFGMSGNKNRHFYNNIGSMDGINYLEIGTGAGSSLVSFLYKNNVKATCIDNFSFNEGKEQKEKFYDNIEKFNVNNNLQIIESDCFSVDVSTLDKFNVYLYDGDHTKDSHYKSLCYFIDCLEDNFIFLVDDWRCSQVIQPQTFQAIESLSLNVAYHRSIIDGPTSEKGWWNGIGIFVLGKNK